MANKYGRHGLVRPSFTELKKLCEMYRMHIVAEKLGIGMRTLAKWKSDAGLTNGKKEDRIPTWKVDKNGCWNCTSHAVDGNGYPAGNRLKGRRSIARLMYEEKFGEITEEYAGHHGTVILHSCDNRMCINPDHLSVGSQADNLKDAYDKRRHAFGERHGNHKLTVENVLEARRLKATMSYSQLAKKYGVTLGTIYPAVVGKTWVCATEDCEE